MAQERMNQVQIDTNKKSNYQNTGTVLIAR